MAMPKLDSITYPIAIFLLPHNTTTEALEKGIDTVCPNCDYQVQGIVGNEALLLCKTKEDQTQLRKLNFIDEFQGSTSCVPSHDLIDEFQAKHLQAHDKTVPLEYNYLQVEGLVIPDGFDEESHTSKPPPEDSHQTPHDPSEDDKKIKQMELMQRKEQNREMQQGRKQRQRDKAERLRKEDECTYPLINHPQKEHNDGVYGKFTHFDPQSDAETFKDRKSLTGVLVAYGKIELEGFGGVKDDKTYFMYDRKFGYHYDKANPNHPEHQLTIGCEVTFKLFKNTVPNNPNQLCFFINDQTVSRIYIAFDVMEESIPNAEPYDNDAFEQEQLAHHAPSPPLNEQQYSPNPPCNEEEKAIMIEKDTFTQPDPNHIRIGHVLPMHAPVGMTPIQHTEALAALPWWLQYKQHVDYEKLPFEGQIISKENRRGNTFTGEIKAYPYYDQEHQGVTLCYHSSLFDPPSHMYHAEIGTKVSFTIGQCTARNKAIATDITINRPFRYVPRYIRIRRSSIGQIIGASKSGVYIQNRQSKEIAKVMTNRPYTSFNVKMVARYNEERIEGKNGNNPTFLCKDLEEIKTYHNALIEGSRFEILPTSDHDITKMRQINGSYKYILVQESTNKDYDDICIMVEIAEIYINAFSNSHGVGYIFFGIDKNGTVIGQSGLDEERRQFIETKIGARVQGFVPSMQMDFKIQFIPLCDVNRHTCVDTFVVKITVPNNLMNKHIKYKTKNGAFYWKQDLRLQFGGVQQCPALSRNWNWIFNFE